MVYKFHGLHKKKVLMHEKGNFRKSISYFIMKSSTFCEAKTMNHNLRTRTITQNFPLLLHVMMMHLKDEEETAHNVSTISQYQSYAKENYFIFSICKRLKSPSFSNNYGLYVLCLFHASLHVHKWNIFP